MTEQPKYPLSTSTFDKLMGAELQRIIETGQIKQIQIYSFSNSVLQGQSREWLLASQTVQVGRELYELSKIVAIRTTEQSLQLYF